MAAHNELGKLGEDMAAKYLLDNGFRIVCRNWHYGRKEVDIIAMDADVLVFVEVKTRVREMSPNDLISYNKVRYLEEAAEVYIRDSKHCGDARFDIVKVTKKRGEYEIVHIPAAFR